MVPDKRDQPGSDDLQRCTQGNNGNATKKHLRSHKLPIMRKTIQMGAQIEKRFLNHADSFLHPALLNHIVPSFNTFIVF